MHHSISQMKHQLDATLCRFYICRVTLHVSGASAHHQKYLKLVQRPLLHVLSLQVSHHISLLGPKLNALRFYFCRVTLHISAARAHHQEYLKLVQRPLVHVLSLQVGHHISLLGPKLNALRFYFCRFTLHVSGASAHHQEYLKLVQRPLVHVLSLQVSHHISLLGPELNQLSVNTRLEQVFLAYLVENLPASVALCCVLPEWIRLAVRVTWRRTWSSPFWSGYSVECGETSLRMSTDGGGLFWVSATCGNYYVWILLVWMRDGDVFMLPEDGPQWSKHVVVSIINKI